MLAFSAEKNRFCASGAIFLRCASSSIARPLHMFLRSVCRSTRRLPQAPTRAFSRGRSDDTKTPHVELAALHSPRRRRRCLQRRRRLHFCIVCRRRCRLPARHRGRVERRCGLRVNAADWRLQSRSTAAALVFRASTRVCGGDERRRPSRIVVATVGAPAHWRSLARLLCVWGGE